MQLPADGRRACKLHQAIRRITRGAAAVSCVDLTVFIVALTQTAPATMRADIGNGKEGGL